MTDGLSMERDPAPHHDTPHGGQPPAAQPLTEIVLNPAARPARPPAPPPRPVLPPVELTIDGAAVSAPAGSTILDACRAQGIDTPTLCYLENLTPVNVCRVCVVEVTGSRVLVPACSRRVESGHGGPDRLRAGPPQPEDGPRVPRLVGRSVDGTGRRRATSSATTRTPAATARRLRPPRPASATPTRPVTTTPRSAAEAEHAQTVAQPVKVDNDLYVRDYAKCILCYKCVEACGEDAQNTFAIAVAGRGFDARISTEEAVPLPQSACVYCGNCIGVCPTGALMFKSEFDMRAAGTWDESKQTVTDTICPYCGVGCTLSLHVQDNTIVKVGSPMDSSVTEGHLCIKGRFGFQFVQNRGPRGGA